MHDYVVVGAGSAGCVLARRLSDDPKRRVLLIEAGPPSHLDLRIRALGLYQLQWRSRLDWNLYTVPQRHVDGRKMYWPRGKVVGGSSCANTAVYIRGHRDNYDAWRDAGNAGWGYDDVLPIFKRSEDNARGASPYHGAGGPLRVSDPVGLSAVSEAFCSATARVCGVKVTDDFNGEEQEGAGHYQVTIRDQVRASAASEFLDPVRGRPNLEILSGALAAGLVIEGGRVRGVRLLVGKREQIVRAEKEVIVCGGAIGSPHLLLLSGIGPAAELKALGVPVVHDLPGVGKNLQDHLLTTVLHDVPPRVVRPISIPNLLGWTASYLARRRGPLGSSPVEAGAFVKSSPAQARPDVQFHFAPWAFPLPNTDEYRGLPPGRRMSILPGIIYPRSVGEIRLGSKDPRVAPDIDPRYFSDDADLEHLVAGVRLSREIAATAPLSAHAGRELSPGPDCKTDEQLRAAVRGACNTIFHPVGTCKMGGDAMAVVDASLRVHGLEGLRVADVSIMPSIIGGNTNAPAIMIGEKAADLVLAAG